MSRRSLATPWPWLAGAVLVILAYLSTIVEFKRVGDDRPVGGIAELEGLAEQQPNVLFILIDTLRADRLEPYGYEKPTSPYMKYFAETGVLFRNNLSQSSWTKSSMASLWTGALPQRSGVTRLGHVIPDAAKMPAEILRDAGYTTAAIYRNGWVDPSFGFGQGFDVYDRPVAARLTEEVRQANPTVVEEGTDWDSVEAAIDFIRFNGKRKWFLYLHLMDVHEYTYEEDDARFGPDYSGIYDASIRHTDRAVGYFVNHLMNTGIFQNTIMVIGSDHGEAFQERGHEGHARFVYRETQEVPLIMTLPFRPEKGIAIEKRSANIDIWPTVLDLMGLPGIDAKDGTSFVPEIRAVLEGTAEPGPGERTTVAHLDQSWGRDGVDPRHAVSVVRGHHRYVMNTEPIKTRELFDQRGDPLELENRIEELPDLASELEMVAQEYLESDPVWGELDTLELDELQLNQLRALGYAIP